MRRFKSTKVRSNLSHSRPNSPTHPLFLTHMFQAVSLKREGGDDKIPTTQFLSNEMRI